MDEPAGGRGGVPGCPPIGTGKSCGENGNYGIVSVDAKPYDELQRAMTTVLSRAAEMHRVGGGRCSLDTAAFDSERGHLQVFANSGSRDQRPAARECLTAASSGGVSVKPCVAGSAAQLWERLAVGGVVGSRLRNAGTQGCLNTELGNLHDHTLNAVANCSTPTDWLWPPSWEHDADCGLMQYCGYPTNWTTMHNVCKYDQSCVSSKGTSGNVGPCDGSEWQRFAFVNLDSQTSMQPPRTLRLDDPVAPATSAPKKWGVPCAAEELANPPRGWNSYDSSPPWSESMEASTQDGAEAAATSLAKTLLPHGFEYMVLDSGWFGEDNLYGTQTIDAWGRLVPNVTQFPAAADGKGFAPLSKKVHGLGLKFGIWIGGGIPRMAVEAKLPVKGTSYTAADIAIVDPEAKNADGYAVGAMDCPWNKWLLHGLNYSHPGTKAYIASLADLYSDDWELDMLKIDVK